MLANMKLESELPEACFSLLASDSPAEASVLPEHTLLFSFMKSTIYFDLETGDSEQRNCRKSVCLTSPTLHNMK